jgi:hypothetical protein
MQHKDTPLKSIYHKLEHNTIKVIKILIVFLKNGLEIPNISVYDYGKEVKLSKLDFENN